MPTTLENVANFRTTDFDEDIDLAFQQMSAMFQQAVTFEPTTGHDATFNVVGPTEAVPASGLFGQTPPPSNMAHMVRVAVPTPWDDVAWLDPDEFDRQMVSGGLQPRYAQNIAAGLARRMDRIILGGAIGSAISRTLNLTTGTFSDTVVAYDTVNQQLVHGSRPFEVDKIIDGKEILKAADAPQDQIYCAITTRQWAQILKDGQFNDFNKNADRPLMTGYIGDYLGVAFIETTLDTLTNLATGVDTAVMWCKQAIGYKQAKAPQSRISLRDDYRYVVQLFASMSGAATRIQDKGVVQIQTLRTA
jgi:hypothetical protein